MAFPAFTAFTLTFAPLFFPTVRIFFLELFHFAELGLTPYPFIWNVEDLPAFIFDFDFVNFRDAFFTVIFTVMFLVTEPAL